MKIYNTLTAKKEEFVPLEEGRVKMYVCGPTVYNLIHIGNARPMIFFDTVRRYFEYRDYRVNFVSNFTDVDDKIIKKANEEGVDPSVISERYIKECKADMASLNVLPATVHPQATQEIQGMIERLQSNSEAAVRVIDDSSRAAQQTIEQARLASSNLEQISGTLGNLSGLNSSIASATLQQSHVVDDINQNVTQAASLAQVRLFSALSADLSITKTDGRTTYYPGQSVTYTLRSPTRGRTRRPAPGSSTPSRPTCRAPAGRAARARARTARAPAARATSTPRSTCSPAARPRSS